MSWTAAAINLLLLTTVMALDTPPAPTGAKELFYDPVVRSLSRASPETSAAPAASATRHTNPGRPRLDANGRRLATVETTSAPGSAARAVGLSYWIELVEPDGGAGTQVTNGRIFHSGERIRLHFRANSEGSIALIQLGSSGTARVLFPDLAHNLTDDRLVANGERILPSPVHWFRFDDNPGTERLLVLFGPGQGPIEQIPTRPTMDAVQTASLLASARQATGSKDLLIETETRNQAEIGTYGVNLAGQPVILEINLEHR